jgi:galactonate dehydratase
MAKEPVQEHAIREIRATVINGEGERSWLFVEVTTASGFVGVGEASQNRLDEGTVAQIKRLAPTYLGQHPLDLIELRGQALRRPDAHRILFAATSALEQALWDLGGQILATPVYRLLGGPVRQQLRLYANIEVATRMKSPAEYAENAGRAVAEGFAGVKLNPFRSDELRDGAGLRRAVDHVGAVRAAIGPGPDLMVDCVGLLDFPTARRALKLLTPHDLFWFEEPLPSADPELLSRLRTLADTRLVGGEQLCGRDAFRPLLERGSFDVLNPDVKWVGGILEAKKIAAMAEIYGVAITPHNMSGPVATAASAQLGATLPNFLNLEYCWGVTPWRADLVDGTEDVHDGVLWVSENPGLGVTLNRAVMDQHRVLPTLICI